MATTTPSKPSSPKDKAITFASQKCFHRSISITIPETRASNQKLRVSFATTSNFESDITAPVILFCGGMGASRLFIFEIDAVARKEGVRVLFIDRPGIGGSTAVKMDQRLTVWLEVVPAVLARLGVETVALVAHSAGTVHAVNTLIHLPHLLDEKKPFIGLLAPWIHHSHSSAPLMQVIEKLPSSLVGKLHHIQSFTLGYIIPSVQFSSGMMGIETSSTEKECLEFHGVDRKIWKEVGDLQGKWMRMEEMSGISEDANLCLQKDAKDWKAYHADLPTTITTLKTLYPKECRQLTISTYFAESDNMIGKGGQAYFEECWRVGGNQQDGEGRGEGGGGGGGGVRFDAKTVEGTDHDSIVLAEKKCIGEIFAQVKSLNGGG